VFSATFSAIRHEFWQNLSHGFLNKFATKWCTLFPLPLDSDSTLPCKTCVRKTVLQRRNLYL